MTKLCTATSQGLRELFSWRYLPAISGVLSESSGIRAELTDRHAPYVLMQNF